MSVYDPLITWCKAEIKAKLDFIDLADRGIVALSTREGDKMVDITKSTIEEDRKKVAELEDLLKRVEAKAA